METQEVKEIIMQLQKKEISVFEVPKEYKNDVQVVTFERESGLRITGKRGFDVISNSFFVEEELIHVGTEGEEEKSHISLSFDNFDSYFDFLNGDIYDNACYTFCRLSEDTIASRKIDIKKLLERKSFIENTIDDYSFSISDKEKSNYENAERIHKNCQQWIEKFNTCRSCDELKKVVKKYNKSKLAAVVDVSIFLFHYIFADLKDKQRFTAIMEYMSSSDYPQLGILCALCSIYNPDDVIHAFNYSLGDRKAQKKYNDGLKKYVQSLKNGNIKFYSRAFFDKETHYYCVEIRGYEKSGFPFPLSTIFRYFKTFEDFIDYRKGDLRHTDLSGAYELNVDFSKYVIDEATILPLQTYKDLQYNVKKKYKDGSFEVIQQWYNIFGRVIEEYKHSFNYLFDFVAFLNGDLSGADLILCDGLEFLEQWAGINFTGAKMKSSLCEKFGLKYDVQEIRSELIESFECVEQNESETALVLQSSRDLVSEAVDRNLSTLDIKLDSGCQRVHYISDLHILHRILNAECRTKEDIIYVIHKIVRTIAYEAGSLLLIDGDVASDFEIFELFVTMLSESLRRKTVVVFTLGNHELWSFPNSSIDEIVAKYRTLLDEHGMYLLHNDVLYQEDRRILDDPNPVTHLIKYDELCEMEDAKILERLKKARYVILGGLGFSGYNMEFNANNGIYRGTIDRNTEINESKKFENLYNRLQYALANKNTIILTHTPKEDWCAMARPDKNLVYVSGHNHANYFYDDGEYRIYSDNQIGYHNDNPLLKTLLIDNDYDCFANYNDGIHEISPEQYKDFYRGKNMPMTFNWEVNALFMLKKNGYYCFIHKSKDGGITLLNGGAKKRLEGQSVQYYYDNMDAMISAIKSPLDKYSKYQKHIADMVKRIGGFGTIHGCIIDIDDYNHIYVNPFDSSITGYWAENIVCKIIYPSIPELLEKNCPRIFSRYVEALDGNQENPLAVKQREDIALLPQMYLDTDIYKASREIKKMQKLSSNVLSAWYENTMPEKPQIGLTDVKEISEG